MFMATPRCPENAMARPLVRDEEGVSTLVSLIGVLILVIAILAVYFGTMNPKYTARIAITRMSTPISDTRVLTPSSSRTRGRAIAFSGHRGVAINIMVPASKPTLPDTQRLGKGGVV